MTDRYGQTHIKTEMDRHRRKYTDTQTEKTDRETERENLTDRQGQTNKKRQKDRGR